MEANKTEPTYTIRPLEWTDQPEASYAKSDGWTYAAKRDGRYSYRERGTMYDAWERAPDGTLAGAKVECDRANRERLAGALNLVSAPSPSLVTPDQGEAIEQAASSRLSRLATS